ncbi:MAG: hypothetical protein ABL857_08690 [Rickettsiales bacterium]
MNLRTDITVESFLKAISEPNGIIDLSTLKKYGGGGTHDIYRSYKCPGLLLKVMRSTIGNNSTKLSEHLQKLCEQYSALYEVFTNTRCIIEKRLIQPIKSSDLDTPQQAIVSVVPFDPCFDSKEKFGFNVQPEELDGVLVTSKRYLYGEVNRFFLGKNESQKPYVVKNYPSLNKKFEAIFKLLDTDKSLKIAMREFLTKYKSFYKKTGILLDTIGFDNVLFYKDGDSNWQFKMGSVIKHDTAALTKKMLEKINENPAIVNESFEAYTSIYFMPACIRALNACSHKVGIGKVIDDIILDEKTIDALAKIHTQMKKSEQALNHAEHGNFSKALELYHQYIPDEKSDDTRARDLMGTLYWDFIKNGGKETSRDEVEGYLKLLLDQRNKIPNDRKVIVAEAIEGLGKNISIRPKR